MTPTPKTVLVVDDEVHIVNVVAMKFRHSGFRVLTAGDPQSAFALAQEHQLDLVITDHHLAGGLGTDLCKLLKSTPATSEIPVILLTAYDFSIVQEEISDCNVCAIIAKPFSPRELLVRAMGILHTGVQD